jgi:hypothetical protein
MYVWIVHISSTPYVFSIGAGIHKIYSDEGMAHIEAKRIRHNAKAGKFPEAETHVSVIAYKVEG